MAASGRRVTSRRSSLMPSCAKKLDTACGLCGGPVEQGGRGRPRLYHAACAPLVRGLAMVDAVAREAEAAGASPVAWRAYRSELMAAANGVPRA